MKNVFKNPIICIFIAALVISWCSQLSFRNSHFQDVDSATVYPMMRDFPAAALRATALFYPSGHIFSTSTAEKILNQPMVRSAKDKYLSSFTDEFILNQLTKTSLSAAMRFAFIQAISVTHLPFPIRSFFAVPLTSTYSAGMGLAYGLITGLTTSYADFMSRSLVITITLFHLTILLLFLINRRLGVSDFANATISIIALFSISMYSSGLNLGSTVWNFSTEFFWIWFLLRHKDNPKIDSLISILTAGLVFFNYLIVFLWISYMIYKLTQATPENFSKNGLREKLSFLIRWLWKTIKAQKVAIIFVGLCGLVFFQTGQGFRGAASLSELPSYSYYVALNFTSWYTHNHVADVIQFILTLGIIYCSFHFIFRRRLGNEMTRQVLLYFFCLYAIAAIFKVLSFVPTRHMLLLSPILFIGAAGGFDELTKLKFEKVRRSLEIIFLTSLVLLGFICFEIRKSDVSDLSSLIVLSPDISIYGIYDLSHDLYYYLKDKGLNVESINPNSFEAGKTYLYISHSEPFEKALHDWQEKTPVQTETIWSKNIVQPVYFTAYNPDFSKLRYSRPNDLYQTKFKVVKITKTIK